MEKGVVHEGALWLQTPELRSFGVILSVFISVSIKSSSLLQYIYKTVENHLRSPPFL